MAQHATIRRFNASDQRARKVTLLRGQSLRLASCPVGCCRATWRTPGAAGLITVRAGQCLIVSAHSSLRIANHDDPAEQLRPTPLRFTPLPFDLTRIELDDGGFITIHYPLSTGPEPITRDLDCPTHAEQALHLDPADRDLIRGLCEPHMTGDVWRTRPLPSLADDLGISVNAVGRRLDRIIATYDIAAPDLGVHGWRTRSILAWAIGNGLLDNAPADN